jgi:tRNA1Val (adenine37-N6)-methyltransferase
VAALADGAGVTVPETVDELAAYGLQLIQPDAGYRFSLDPLLLADFATVADGDRVMDLGTGSGIIPLLIHRRLPMTTLVGIEHQQTLAAIARRNVEINGAAARVEIVELDLLHLRQRFKGASFDRVLANPPYRRQGSGKISPRPGRDRARHESTATLADFLAAAHFLVRPGGTISFIYHVSRLSELLVKGDELRMALVRLRFVHDQVHKPAKLVLAEFCRGGRGELQVLPPLLVRDEGGYSPEMCNLFGDKGREATLTR